ncbi:MAG: hypothetical protein ACTSSP_05825, partial [Candidatus Asgardarchaeia archaeon]
MKKKKITLLLGLALSVLLLLNTTSSNFTRVSATDIIEVYGDWIIETDTTYSNAVIIVTGNVIVKSGATLQLNNVTLIINSSSSQTFYIEIQNGARFIVNNSLIKPKTISYRYYMVARSGSVIEFYNSTIEYAGLSMSYPGIRVSSTKAIFSDVTIRNNYCGIYLSGAVNTTLENIII